MPVPIEADPEILERLTTLLGFRRAASARQLTLAAATRIGGMVRLEVADARGNRSTLRLAAADGTPWAANGSLLKCSYEGASLTQSHALAMFLMRGRLDRLPFDELASAFGPEPAPPGPAEPSTPPVALPELEPPPPPPAGVGTVGRSAGPSIYDWGHPDQWREFTLFPLMVNTPGQTFPGMTQLESSATVVRHGDLECQISVPDARGQSHSFFDVCSPVGGFSSAEIATYITFPDDRDVVMGTGTQALERALGRVGCETGCRSVQLINGCIPMMVGDDARGALAAFSRRTGVPTAYAEMSPSLSLCEVTVSRLKAAVLDGPAPAVVEGSFNLVGFPWPVARDELVSLLAAAGATFGVALVPDVDVASARRFRAAALNVLLPNRFQEEAYRDIEAAGGTFLRPPGPFGPAGTRSWVRGVAEALGPACAAAADEALDAAWRPLASRWDALASEARAYRLGFVVGEGDGARLADPSFSMGACLPALVEEMGFGLVFLVHAGDPKVAALEVAPVMDRLVSPGNARVVPFDGPVALGAALRESGLHAACSNVLRDHRLLRNGVAAFRLRQFEPGLAGAVRTAERLVSACGNPFYRTWRTLLGGWP